MDEIEWQKDRIREAIWGFLGVYPGSVYLRMEPPLLRPLYLARLGFAKLLTSKPAINVAFWLPLALRMRTFRPAD